MARTPLNEHCSAVLLKKLPEKLGDPGKFLIPFDFPGMAECLALANLDASINLMPFFVWKRHSLLNLTPTCMTLELVDRSISRSVGVAEEVYVKVGSFHFPAEFVVVDFDADPRVHLILRRSFLKIERALIDMFEGELTLHVGKEAITFNLDQTSRYSANYSDMTVKRIDVIDMACEEYSQEVLGFSDTIVSGNPTPFYDLIVSTTSSTPTPFGNSDFLLEEVDAFLAIEDDPTSLEFYQPYLDPEGDILLLEAFLNDDPSLPSPKQGNYLPEVRKELKICEAKYDKSSVDEPSKVELKDLPPHLKYAFLEGDDKLPVIIAKDLSVEEKTALITVLKSHKRAIAWRLSNIKGINPEFYTHKILMEEDFKPAVQHQRRVNPKIHDVIKQEVIKLLEAGLIYPISDSPWVSPVHSVPKKGGFTVVENEDNELIPTRLVTGWCVCIDYRKLIEATRKDHFHLPFMDQMLERLAGNQYYCFLDGTFQRCMMAIFHDMIEKTMEVFMDDFSIFGNSFQSCISHLERMLKRCEDTNLRLNWEKSHFMVKEGIVLGHKIFKQWIEVDKAKVDIITKLPHPTTVKDWDIPFELMCDASDFAIGAVLGQRQDKHFRPIHYATGDHRKVQINELNELRDQAYENSLIYKEKTKRLHDSKIKNRVFNIGDKVLLFNSRLKISSRKLKSHWSGPFTISQVYPYGTVELLQPDGPNFKVNGHHLKHYFGEDLPKLTHAEGFSPPVFISSASLGNHTSGQVEVSNRGLKRILERAVCENRASWSDNLDDALWAFCTAYKTPFGCTPYKMVYEKACHLPVELEHKAYWALKYANFDLKAAGDHRKVQINELNELCDQAYENSLIYKEKTKRLHDSKIKNRVFNIGDRVLLFNSRLKISSRKLKSRWSGPFTISQPRWDHDPGKLWFCSGFTVSNSSSNPTPSTNPKGLNHRRSKQRIEDFNIEELSPPIVTMADQQLHQLDTFYNALNSKDQNSLNSIAGVNYNQGNTSYHPLMMSNQIRPPGFPPVPNNQNAQLNQRNNQNLFIPNQNRGNNFNQGPVYQPLIFQPSAYQAPAYQALAPQTQGVSKEDFSAYVKANDVVMRNMQIQGQNMQNQLTNLTDLITKFVNSNSASTSSSGTLPSNTIANPRSDLKAITTRQSGVSYDGPQTPPPLSFLPKVVENKPEVTKDTVNPTNKESTEDVQPQVVQSEYPILTSEPVTSLISEPVIAPVSASKPNPKASIPYPSRRNDERNHEKANNKIEKFYQIFKDMSFEISFADALILMPKFASTLKALIGNKEKLSEMARTPLNEYCSAVLLKKLPKKLGDPCKFLIPCDFPGMAECLALADLGASINLMLFSVWKRLSLPDLTPTCMTLELADHSISRLVGVAEDVYVKTGRALIDVFEGSFGFFDTISSGNPTPFYDLIVSTTSLTLTPFGNSDFLLEEVDAFLAIEDDPTSSEFYQPYLNPEGDILLLEAFLNDDPSLPPPNQINYLLEGGFTVVENEDNELIPTRLVTERMLKRYEDTNLCLNWEKSHFMVKEGIVLSHKISKQGIEVDKAKVDVITKLPHPTTVKEAESNYTTTEKEMLAVVYAFEKFRSYLIMNKSIVYTEQSALKYLFAKKDSKARLIRWVLLLQEFTFKAIDTKRAENLAADHLSRLEIPHQNMLDHKEINKSFPLETLNLVSTRGENRATWSDKLDDALWAFRTAYKTPIECTSYKLVYEKACHHPVELEHKAYWALKHANFNLKTTGDHRKVQINELNELHDQAYENSLIYKEKTKRLHDFKIKNRFLTSMTESSFLTPV
nr:reverse transcriptase domain-containing protein [Tanacetum cinerariifolium]